MKKLNAFFVALITSFTVLNISHASGYIPLEIPKNATHEELVELINARNEPGKEQTYREFAEGIKKLNLGNKIDLTLPNVKYPYSAWLDAHDEEFQKYAGIAAWIAGETQKKLECEKPARTTPTSNKIDARALRSTFRNFNVIKYVKKVPGFTDCGLNEAEYAAIYDYTAEIYQTLNPALRKGYVDTDVTAFVSALTQGLNKIGKFKGWVKRGDNLSAQRKARYVPGAIVQDAGFMSTSINVGFRGADQFQIYSRTGRYIAPLSHNHSEEEVIFLPNTKFKVVEVTVDEKDAAVTNYKMIELPN